MMLEFNENIIFLGEYKFGLFTAVREDRMPGGRNSGAVYNLYKVKTLFEWVLLEFWEILSTSGKFFSVFLSLGFSISFHLFCVIYQKWTIIHCI